LSQASNSFALVIFCTNQAWTLILPCRWGYRYAITPRWLVEMAVSRTYCTDRPWALVYLWRTAVSHHTLPSSFLLYLPHQGYESILHCGGSSVSTSIMRKVPIPGGISSSSWEKTEDINKLCFKYFKTTELYKELCSEQLWSDSFLSNEINHFK
jgi:hypothetical protein